MMNTCSIQAVQPMTGPNPDIPFLILHQTSDQITGNRSRVLIRMNKLISDLLTLGIELIQTITVGAYPDVAIIYVENRKYRTADPFDRLKRQFINRVDALAKFSLRQPGLGLAADQYVLISLTFVF